LRAIAFSGKDYLDQMLARESKATGINSLKIASNNVFGYYIEVRNTHKDKVPEHWIRKQTLVNAERYITEELKEYEQKILGAEDQILKIEQAPFFRINCLDASIISKTYNKMLNLLAQLDCLSAFAHLAKQNKYTTVQKLDDSL